MATRRRKAAEPEYTRRQFKILSDMSLNDWRIYRGKNKYHRWEHFLHEFAESIPTSTVRRFADDQLIVEVELPKAAPGYRAYEVSATGRRWLEAQREAIHETKERKRRVRRAPVRRDGAGPKTQEWHAKYDRAIIDHYRSETMRFKGAFRGAVARTARHFQIHPTTVRKLLADPDVKIDPYRHAKRNPHYWDVVRPPPAPGGRKPQGREEHRPGEELFDAQLQAWKPSTTKSLAIDGSEDTFDVDYDFR